MADKLLIKDCRLFNAAEDETTCVLIEDGIITEIGQIDAGAEVLDAHGQVIIPGFIEVHIQGAGGADVLDATEEALRDISKACVRFGMTSFLATTVFKLNQDNSHLGLCGQCVGRDLGGANLLGVHLEGPFISLEKRGMIQPGCICPATVDTLDEILKQCDGHLKMMTIAPEVAGGLDVIKRLVKSNVIASFAHSSANYEETLAGFSAGISHVTHLFNAMVGMHHRLPGPLVAIFQTKEITAQVIPDGVHVHPAVLKFAFDLLGADRFITITDGMMAMGLPDGKYIYNGIEYESKDGASIYKDGTLIGTSLGLSDLLKRLMKFTGCSLAVAVKTMTENPAKLLGIEDKKGFIAVGKDADLVLLDDELRPDTTIVGGKVVFQRE